MVLSKSYGMASGGFTGRASGSTVAPSPSLISNGKEMAQNDGGGPPVKDEKQGRQRSVLESKLHPSLLEVFDCWTKSGAGCKSAPDGKVKIIIFLGDNTSQVLDQLKALGFEVSENRTADKSVVGTLAVEKLDALAKLDVVRFVSLARK